MHSPAICSFGFGRHNPMSTCMDSFIGTRGYFVGGSCISIKLDGFKMYPHPPFPQKQPSFNQSAASIDNPPTTVILADSCSNPHGNWQDTSLTCVIGYKWPIFYDPSFKPTIEPCFWTLSACNG
jgi:hypothetical protein